MIHTKIFIGLQKELEAKYKISSTIKHKGERGRNRETGVASFLKENLPEAFGVGTGEVFSFGAEEISPQCDIIIYDRLRTPIFGKSNAVQQIPIEGVFAIIEVRSIIDVGALKNAGAKCEAIQKLWLASKPEKASPTWDNEGPTFYLFGFKLKTTPDTCLTYLRNGLVKYVCVVALDSGCSVWVEPSNKSEPAWPIWLDAKDSTNGMYFSLAFFYFTILKTCQAGPHRIDFGIENLLLSER